MTLEETIKLNLNNINNIKIPTSMLDSVMIDSNMYFINLIKQYLIPGKMLKVGGSFENHHNSKKFWGVTEYINVDINDDKHPLTIAGDITDCKNIFSDNTFDFVECTDTFEHIAEPWKAAKEIIRILKPGGITFIKAPFSWRYHPVPIDYWRFSPQCLINLFKELECIECNWESLNRRHPMQGSTREDTCPEDHVNGYIGVHGWLENWRVYYLGIKK